MKIAKQKKYVEEEIFIAEDGTSFNSKKECIEHEKDMHLRSFGVDIENIRINNLDGKYPLDTEGFGVSSGNEFSWYKIRNKNELDFLCEYYNYDYREYPDTYPEIYCVETAGEYDHYLYSLSKMKRDTIAFWDMLGFEVAFKKSNNVMVHKDLLI